MKTRPYAAKGTDDCRSAILPYIFIFTFLINISKIILCFWNILICSK